ncbi:MAG: efflux RND transporter periplasmic adaptor subunit [Bacteroidales bacterium]|nr:efflux RND transporter periplasmic adaptor subunit [Bacteroidales bacterium]
MKTLRVIILIVMGVGLVTLHSCSSNESKGKTSNPVPVKIYSPSQIEDGGLSLSGEIVAKQTANISTRMMGYINKIYVKPGDKVSQGQLLLSISNDDILAKKSQVQAMINEAEAAVKNAERDYERFKTLRQQNSVSDKELENVSLQRTSMLSKLEMARQQMNEVNAMLAYTNIRAPFSGVITQKMADEGSMANPGMPLLVMEQNSELQVIASVPENHIRNVKVGDVTKITLKSIGETIDGRIIELSPSAHRTGGQYAMKIAIDVKENKNIHAGMYVNIRIPNVSGQEEAGKVMVNRSSIVFRDQLTGVYVINDKEEASLRWVRLGHTSNDLVEVLSGLKGDEKIILEAKGKLYNGVKVSITN